MSDFDNPHLPRSPWRVWLVSAIVSAIIVLGYAAVWFLLAVSAREQLQLWIEEQRSKGFTVRYDTLEATGFPFRIRLDITNPGFGAPHIAPPWGWEGERLSLEMTPWRSDILHGEISGGQMLALPVNGKTESYTGVVQNLKITLFLDNGSARAADLAFSSLVLKPDNPGAGPFRIERAKIHLEELPQTEANYQKSSAMLSGEFENAILPWLSQSPLGRQVESLGLEIRLMGTLARGPLVSSLEDWRDGGGTIEVGKLDVQHGPLNIKTDGTIALDGSLQPIGALTARIQGFFEAIDALKQIGIVKPRDAITAKMVLGVLARKPKEGGPATLNLALTVQERRLYAGPVPLIEIPRVIWRGF